LLWEKNRRGGEEEEDRKGRKRRSRRRFPIGILKVIYKLLDDQ
jgi:hypothetical protein